MTGPGLEPETSGTVIKRSVVRIPVQSKFSLLFSHKGFLCVILHNLSKYSQSVFPLIAVLLKSIGASLKSLPEFVELALLIVLPLGTLGVVLSPRADKKLTQGVMYHLFVRTWYDNDTYAVFRSDGITVDVTPPQISTIRGTKVR